MVDRPTPVVLVLVLSAVSPACGPSPGDGERPPSCGAPPLIFDPGGDVLQGKDDEGACVRLERRPIGEPGIMYKEYPYEPVRLTAAARDTFVDVTDGAALEYTPTHHNWLDDMRGTGEDGTTAAVVIRYRTSDDSWVLELTLTGGDGELLAGPLPLEPEGSRVD